MVVTFDDGYRDFHDTALPLLVKHRVPAVLYLATSLVANGHGAAPSDALTWTQLREAVDTGLVTIGSHTHGHADLSKASEREAEDEMRRSKDLIEDHLGTACTHFAYPWAVGSPAADRAARRLFRSGGARCVDDESGRPDGPLSAGTGADPAERRPVLLPSQGARAARHGSLALPRAQAGTVGEGVREVARVAHVATVDLSLRFLLLPQLRALRDAGFDVTTISAPGPWVSELEAEGIRHIPWPGATRAWDPRSDVRAFRELVAIFRRERFDLVHTHNPKPGVIGRVAARVAGVPHVMNTVHGLYATPEDRLRRRAPVLAAEWIAARCSDLELYQSAEDLAWARRLHLVRRDRSLHLGNGIDLTAFTPGLAGDERVRKLRAELGIGEDELVVGTVGRMVREKGYEELFDAARIVRSRIPNARFLAVGGSDLDKEDAITRRGARAGQRRRRVHRLARGHRGPDGADGCVRAAVVARGPAAVRGRGRGERPAAGPHRHPRVPGGRPGRRRGVPGAGPRSGPPGRRDRAAPAGPGAPPAHGRRGARRAPRTCSTNAGSRAPWSARPSSSSTRPERPISKGER